MRRFGRTGVTRSRTSAAARCSAEMAWCGKRLRCRTPPKKVRGAGSWYGPRITASRRRARCSARAAQLDLLGFYHSHPDHPAKPSQFDLDHAWPSFSYVIVSVMAGRDGLLTSWQLKEDRSAFGEELVEVTNSE